MALLVSRRRLPAPSTETRKAHLNHDTRRHALPPLAGNVLTDGRHSIDNLLATAWKTLRLSRILLRAGFSKRHGIEVTEMVFVLMVWRWLNVSPVAMFCRTALGLFSRRKKDVLYDFLKREDVDWRRFNLNPIVAEIGRSVITPIKPGAGSEKVRHFRESGNPLQSCLGARASRPH